MAYDFQLTVIRLPQRSLWAHCFGFSNLDERWRLAPELRYPGAIALRYALHAEALTMASVLGVELVCSSYNPASHKRRQA